MPDTTTCPKCSGALPSDAPGGICPQCLLLAGLDSDQSTPKESWSPFAVTTPQPGGFIPPVPASLAAQFPLLEIFELLGHGGMGAVYKARQTKLDRLVALKVIRPESAADPAFAERFNREARTLARLSHPHIVSVHDFGEVNITDEATGQPRSLYYFVMEYIDGVNLRQLMQSGDLQPDQTLAIIPQICDALQFAHDEGVIHRDIKPENILIDRRGRVKIADFGLAKLASGSQQDYTLTATHQVMGTPRYMAPEQMEGSHSVDHRADIYSLGVVFYEMLTGQVPAGHFDLPSRKSPIDARLDGVILKALARDPGGRFQRASELKSDVEAIALPQFSTMSATASEMGRYSGTVSRPGFSTIAGGQVVGAWRWMAGDVALEQGAQGRAVAFPSFLMVIIAVVGCLLVLAPWFELHFPLEAEVNGHPIAEAVTQTTSGIEVVPGGIFLTTVFAVLALFLLITPTHRAPRLWRSILLTVLSFLALLLTLSLKTNANLQRVKLPAATFQHRLTDNLGNVEHHTTYCWGFMGTVGCSLMLLVLSATAVRHACSDNGRAETLFPQTSNPVSTPTHRSQGEPLVDFRFTVIEPCDVLQQARFHFGNLGYELIRREADECVFERGYSLAGALEFDIRRYKTWLTVRVSPADSGRRHVGCNWSVVTMGAWITKHDTSTLKAEGEQFAAFLGVAVTGVDGSSGASVEPSRTATDPVPASPVFTTDTSAASSVPRTSNELNLDQARNDVDGPSLALIVFGVLMLIGHIITVVICMNNRFDDDMAVIGVPGALIGLGMIFGGLNLRNFRSRGWSQMGVIMAVIPASLGWPITLLIGIWVWNVLSKPHVRRAFVETTQRRQKATNPSGASRDSVSSSEFDLVQVRSDVDGPSLALIVIGLLTTIGHMVLLIVGLSQTLVMHEIFWIGIPASVIGIGMMLGGFGLRGFRSRGWAQLGAIMALVPASFDWPLTMFIGIWVWKVLARPNVRRAFVETALRRHNAA